MSTITILGAGAMGSAIATPLSDAGHRVRLWGTHLDDHLIVAVRDGKPHPRTKVPLADGVATFLAGDLEAALDGADVVVLAVSSVGVIDITQLAASHLLEAQAILLTSKGFAPDQDGRITLLPQAVEAELFVPRPVVAVGGPCKANEVAARRPTAAIFAAADGAQEWARFATTEAYRVANTPDRDGVELCAALKNVYAIALGIADGLGERGGELYHDLKAAAFAQALAELRRLLAAEGADPWTALGLAGAGDLEVTGLSGRNKVYGTCLGAGQAADEALAEMVAAEQTVEGVPAVALAATFVQQRHPELAAELPLLHAIHAVVHEGAGLQHIINAALPR